MKISAVLIVQDEEKLLPRCLDSLKGVDEIVIADQGSIDRTISVAQRYTDKIFTNHKWEDSFCKARNEAKSHATGDWIISIDADEFLHDYAKLREAVIRADAMGVMAIDVKMIAEDNGQWFMYPRVFRNHPSVYWVGDIHNHLSVQGSDIGDIQITHGYSPAHLRDPDRALRILEKSVATTKGPREMFYLGREYFYRRRYEDSINILEQYVQTSRYLAEKADAYLILARCYWFTHRADEARENCLRALVLNANFKEAILFMAEMSWEHNAIQWKRMAETANNDNVLFVRGAFV